MQGSLDVKIEVIAKAREETRGRMEKLTRSQKCVFAIVITLGFVSATLGFLAEAYRVKASDIKVKNNECIYPESPALVLGVTAALLLFVAQIILNMAGGCICCTQGPPLPPHSVAASNRSIAIICLVACWITFLNAFALLMAGASLNNEHDEYLFIIGVCNNVKPLVFAGGALLSVATVVLGLIFYLASCVAKAGALAIANASQGPPPSIALGQPYPPYYVPHNGNLGIYGMHPYPARGVSFGHPNPNAPQLQNLVIGYPDMVTGYPKPLSPTRQLPPPRPPGPAQ